MINELDQEAYFRFVHNRIADHPLNRVKELQMEIKGTA